MNVLVGMSGYSYKEWKGGFYPEDLPAEGMLPFYAERFPAVEINNTFYRMPTEKLLLQWAGQVPADFVFVLKATRRITHMNRLKGVAEHVEYFLRTGSVLGARQGPSFFQLPPNFKKDLPLLQDFLSLIPPRCPAAMEFRHESWFSDDVYQALKSHDVALCVVDSDTGETPFVPTASWGYLRLRSEAYDQTKLQAWADRIRSQPWERAYTFLKHEEDAGLGPQMALKLRGILDTK
ncbi:MAG: DUF72 domain-containing protein [Gemmatimonadota bacterium]